MTGWIIGPDTALLACEYDLVICCVSPPLAPPLPSPTFSSGSLDPQTRPLHTSTHTPQSASGPDSDHGQESVQWAESMAHAAVCCMFVVPLLTRL